MAKIIGLPKLSPTMEEGVLLRWTKEEGDAISVDDLMAEVETDKAVMEFRAFDDGVLLKRLVDAGTSLAPDAPVAIVGKAGEDIQGLLASLLGKTQDPLQLPPAQPVAEAKAAPEAQRGPSGRVLASPCVRKRARELDFDLTQVRGTGPRGRIILRDLDSVSETPPKATPPSRPVVIELPVQETTQRVALTPMRKTIANRMVEAKREAPHFYLHADVNAGALVAARKTLQGVADAPKLSLNDLVVFALSRALRKVPQCNVSFGGDHIAQHADIHLAVAVSIPGGLVTPVLRHADRLTLSQLSSDLRQLSERARAKTLRADELQGGTCSVSNLGMFGVDGFSAILNPPQACILSIGAVRDEPVVEQGQVVAGKRMTLGISCDHRAVDGADAAKLLAALRILVEQPLSLLL